MKIRVFETMHDAGLYTATCLEQVLQYQPNPVLGLATGGSVVPLYEQLVRLTDDGSEWAGATTINLDEYIGLAPSHPQSYRRFMDHHLFNKLHDKPHHIYIPNGNALDLAAECEKYDQIIRNHPIDIQILGIGVNGHIGFNEPDSLLQSRTHVVKLREETIESNARFFASSDEVPRKAITVGVQAILQAKRIILLAFGEAKADIIARTIAGEVRTDIPASMLQLHADVTIVLDAASAKRLSKR